MSKSKAQNRKHHPFLLVGVGAAAGGLEAFAEFLKAIGDCPGLAVVYFQHAEPNWHPLSNTLLSSSTSLPLVRLSGRHELKPNTVYFAPTNQRVEIVGNQLIATELSHEESAASPIDHFFNQVSLSYGEHAVGVVLSGAGSDGTLGLKSISDRGGMTFAQSPESAQFDAMPRSAATIGVADHVLPPADIAKELLRYARYLADHYQIAGKVSETDQIENAIPRITDILMRETDHNFRHYKINTLCRRLQRRMHVLQIGQVEDYVKRIDTDKTELHNLFRELLIGVTAFFRDPIAFERLAEKVIPELFANRKPDEVVRIWVPGCATGEEAYSMAILCREWIEAHNIEYAVQIFASDIDELALSTARKGIYPIGIEDQVSSERLEKYFIKKGKRYHIASKVREMVLFSSHNLISDPPFSRQDLISCRNLLIYLGPHLQKKLIPLFHYSLRPKGFLFLGPSENISSHAELFRSVDAKHRISQRKGTAISTPASKRNATVNQEGKLKTKPLDDDKTDMLQVMQRIILDEFAPKSVVVDEQGQIVCSSGDTSKYLSTGEGAFRNDIVRMARSGLRIGLRAALSEAKTKRRRVVHDNVSVQTSEGKQRVMITVQPMMRLGEDSGLHLVVFQDIGLPLENHSADVAPQATTVLSEGSVDRQAYEMIEQLERELASTRQDLDQTMQDMEATNEELKSSNEELLSMNEELQSANEELETSKEEIRSGSNALARVNADLQNLLRSTQIASIFLDEDLCIRSFTPAATEIYGLIPTDIGRPLTQIVPYVDEMPSFPALEEIRAGAAIEHTLVAHSGKFFIRRILPYHSADGHRSGDGIVVTFVDVTELQESKNQYAFALQTARMGAFEWDYASDQLVFDEMLLSLYDLPSSKLTAETVFNERVHPDDIENLKHSLFQTKETGGDYEADFRIIDSSGIEKWVSSRGKWVRGSDGERSRLIGINWDTTEEMRQNEALENYRQQLEIGIAVAKFGVGRIDYRSGQIDLTPEAARLYGLGSQPTSLSRSDLHATFHQEDQLAIGQAIAGCLDPDSDGIMAYEHRVIWPDQSVHWLDVRKQVFFDKSVTPPEPTHGILAARDITERKERDESLRQSQSRLRVLFDHSYFYTCILDLDGKLIDVNEAAIESIGVDREVIIGQFYWDTPWWEGHKNSQAWLREKFESALRGESQREELAYPLPNGQTGYSDFVYTPATDEDGQVLFIVANGSDVTERHQAVEALAESRKRLSLAMKSARMGSFVWDRISDEVIWDEEWLNAVGLPVDAERVGKTLFDMVHPDDRERLQAAIEESLGNSSDYRCEFRIIRPSGELRWLAAVGNWVDRGHETPRRLAGLNWDITEQKETENEIKLNEERLRVAAGAAGFGMFHVDVENDSVHWTDEFRRLVGIGPDKYAKVSIHDVPDFVHPEDVNEFRTRFQSILNDLHEPDHWFSHRIVKQNGETRHVRIQTRSLYDETSSGRRVKMIVGTLLDITQQREYEKKLQKQKRIAEAANRSKSEFVANMSHEIRTPMTAILGYTELLQELVSDDEAIEHLRTIRRNGDYLLEIINDILDLSKIEAGKMEIDIERFRPDRVIEDVRSIMEVRAIEGGLDLEVEYATKIPAMIESDGKRLKQILINLIGNAIKFTQDGQVKMVVGMQQNQLSIDVVDTGIGMSKEQQYKLFKPFSQADAWITQQFGGTGLGLAISQRLAAMLGGRITCQSELGEGSTFSATFDVGDISKVKMIQPDGKTDVVTPSKQLKMVAKLDCDVLVVDDRRDIRFLSKRILTTAGATVTEAEDGLIALETVREKIESGSSFDLIVLDMQMPNLDGYETAKQLRQMSFTGPIIALTADAMQGDMNRCLSSGCNDYLSKPIDAQRLLELVDRLTKAS